MASPDPQDTGKRPRLDQDQESPEATAAADPSVLEYLLSQLSFHHQQPNGSDNGSDNDKDRDKAISFKAKMENLGKDKVLLTELQDSIADLLKEVDKGEARVNQEYSCLMVLDKGIRDTIVSFLDEEGLMVLEASTMMKLDPEEQEKRWKELWEMRPQAFPQFWKDGDDNVTEEDGPDYRVRGTIFGKASRSARGWEALAQTHYGTDFPVRPCGNLNMHWPTGICRTLREDRDDLLFFARITYYDDPESGVPLVLEGFLSLRDGDIRDKPGDSDLFFELLDVDENVLQALYRKFTRYFDSEFEGDIPGTALLAIEEDMADHMSITIVQTTTMIPESAANIEDMELVVSTTGYSPIDQHAEEDFFMLSRRSPDFSAVTAQGEDSLRIGLGQQPKHYRAVKIILTG